MGHTSPTPALPCIAAPGADAALMFDVLARSIADLPDRDRDILRLKGLVRITPAAYLAVPTPPTPAALGLCD